MDNDLIPVEGDPLKSSPASPTSDLIPVEGNPLAPPPLPAAFSNRVLRGDALRRALGPIEGFATGLEKNFDVTTPFGLSQDTIHLLQDHGIFSNPATGRPGLLSNGGELLARTIAKGSDATMRLMTAAVGGAGGAVASSAEHFGLPAPESERLGREVSSLIEKHMIESGSHSRLELAADTGAGISREVGHPPTSADFETAAANIGGKETKAKLDALWQERGIHPAELAHDAKADAFLKSELTNPEPPVTLPIDKTEAGSPAEAEQLINGPETEQPLRAMGADIVTGPLPSVAQQPPLPAGRLVDAGRKALDGLMGLGKNLQYILDPMATGSDRAMVIAKDAINSVRRIRWEHAQRDADIARRFTREQQERMWNAADEESVARQLGESTEHQGLTTLEPEERALVEDLHKHLQTGWLQAVDAGMVEGEGLPAYTPRMVLNVAAAFEHGSPQALNELGRNAFTRTAQMKHRRYMMAEETETAAKELVTRQMEERGASANEISEAVAKVAIARNIRALPLALAKLQEATIWASMIKNIEEVGKAAGSDTVKEFNPGGGWFTIAGNPTFTRWRPALERNPVTGKWGARTDDSGRPFMEPRPIYMAPEFKGPMTAILDESANKGKIVNNAQSVYGALMTLKAKSMTAILNSPLTHGAIVWSKVAEAAGGRELLGFGLYGRGNNIIFNNPARASELIERGLSPIGPRAAAQDITSIMEQPNVLVGHHESWTGKLLAFVPGLFDEAAGQLVERGIAKAGDVWHNGLLWNRVRDVQFGLADHLSDRFVAQGVDRVSADRMAAHVANVTIGSIPKEAMSSGARAVANILLFSRSFTLGNLSVYKQAVVGLPKPILAQIERDYGMPAAAAIPQAAQQTISKTAQSIATRKALSTIALSVAGYYITNAILENGLNIALRDSSIDEEARGYIRRYHDFMTDVSKDPTELRHIVGRLSPVYENEPDKQDRVHLGYAKDGTAIYVRNVIGKYGEELVGYPTHPMKMLTQKLSPLAGAALDLRANDAGFGRPIYDEKDNSVSGLAKTAWNVAKYVVQKHLPEGQIEAAGNLLRGDGEAWVNGIRLVGPAVGFTASQGAPGGMARGEQLSAKRDFESRFNIAWPKIRTQIKAGDLSNATDTMNALGVPLGMQRGLIRSATNPAALSGRTLRDFYQYATPEQKARFERAEGR